MTRLEDWSFVCEANGYDPPELIRARLMGRVYGHPRHEDGKQIETTPVVSVTGNHVRTRSGSEYLLGTPSEGYRAWLKKHFEVSREIESPHDP